MNTLRQSIAEYLALRRSLGFKMNDAARALPDFATFMERRRAAHITQALALTWAQIPTHAQPSHWASRLCYVRQFARYRDHAWLLVAVQTGLRLSELTSLTWQTTELGSGAHVHVMGKGRKERCVPLTKQTVAVLSAWFKDIRLGDGHLLFPNRRGGRLSNDGLQYLLAKHTRNAQKSCVSLCKKRVSPHVLRHTAAMELLQAGADTTVIALWLGHESVETTHIYLEADLAMKEKMLTKTTPHDGRPGIFKPDDSLLAFLRNL